MRICRRHVTSPARPDGRVGSLAARLLPRKRLALRLACASAALAIASPAAAQLNQWNGRGFITINGGIQALTREFSNEAIFTTFGGVYAETVAGSAAQEPSSFQADYRFKISPLFDMSGGIRVWRNVGFGLGVSRFGHESEASVSAVIPHPLFFDRNRSVNGMSHPVTRSEIAVHLQAMAVFPTSRSLTVTVFGGPTFFSVTQRLVHNVLFEHSYPFDTATFSGTGIRLESSSGAGLHAGADIAYYFTDTYGVGWLVRFGRATIKLPSAGDGTVSLQAGGVHAAGGLRVRF